MKTTSPAPLTNAIYFLPALLFVVIKLVTEVNNDSHFAYS